MDMKIGVAQTPMGMVPVVELTLSERNLKTLLLNIGNPDDNMVTRLTENGLFMIRGESDQEHYKDRPAGDGYDPLTRQLLDTCECESVEPGDWCEDCSAHKAIPTDEIEEEGE